MSAAPGRPGPGRLGYPGFTDERTCVVGGVPLRASATDPAAWNAEVVVGVALHNQATALPECLASIAAQRCRLRVATLVFDDASTDDWMGAAGAWLKRPGLVAAGSRCGSAARSRNRILDLVDALFPAARWVARLDADDRFADPCSLAAACTAGEQARATYVLGGNRLRASGELLARSNPASDLLFSPGFVLGLLARMADGSAENELPSCNLLLARGSGVRYPDVGSGEDHWLVSRLLICRPEEGAIFSAPFYCDYSVNGSVTAASRRSTAHVRSRRALYRAARRWTRVRTNPGVGSCC